MGSASTINYIGFDNFQIKETSASLNNQEFFCFFADFIYDLIIFSKLSAEYEFVGGRIF